MKRLGLFGVTIPERHGGMGLGEGTSEIQRLVIARKLLERNAI
jgi:alkylation response protein AidB-like acyl-CoA dehydrogenase